MSTLGRRVAFAGGTLAALAGGAWLWLRPPHGSDRGTSIPSVTSSATHATERAAGSGSIDTETAVVPRAHASDVPAPEAARSAITPTPLQGVVVDASGTAVPGATVSWTALTPGAWAPYDPPGPVGRAAIAAATRWTTSDERGVFAFDDDPRSSPEAPSVLWITCPGFVGASSLQAGRIAGDPRIVLEARDPRDVRVGYADGTPTTGATVQHLGVFPIDNDFSDPLRVASGYAFHREATSDALGAPQPPLVHVNVGELMVATLASQVSAPWRETRENKELPVALTLDATFLASGRVAGEVPGIDWAGAEVSAVGWRDFQADSVAAVEVLPDGTWGPMVVPLVQGLKYTLLLRGGDLADEEVAIDVPAAGEHVRHDFAGQRGVELEVRVLDDSGAPVRGAQVMVRRGQPDGALISHFGATDALGSARLPGVRPGLLQVSAEAPGLIARDLDWAEYSGDREEPILVTLLRSRPVSGRVIFEGAAVEDFTVVWWTAAMLTAGLQRPESFSGRKEGEFELSGTPEETLWLMASAPGLSRSTAYRCTPGEARSGIVLELRPAGAARGRIVDATTGEPIATATVQLWMNRGKDFVHPGAAAQHVDAQGSFELVGLAPGDNRFVVDAPGYSDYLGVAFGREGQDLDLGVIALPRAQELVVALAWEGELDPTQYSASLVGTSHEGPLGFAPDGSARFPRVSPGWTRIVVRGADGSVRRKIVLLLPGADWSFDVPVSSGAALELQVVAPAGESVPAGLSAVVFLPRARDSRAPELESYVQVNLDERGRGLLRGAPEGPFTVSVYDSGNIPLAAANGTMGAGDQRFEVALAGRHAMFRVVDRAGDPVPEADVFLWGTDPRSSWNHSSSTNSGGEVLFHYVPYERVIAGARHPERGMTFGHEVDLSRSSEPILLRLDASDSIHVLLLERGVPSSGTRVVLTAAGTGYLIGDLSSDADGRVHWPDVSGATFDLRVTQPGHWPRRVPVRPATRAEPERVAVYRTASATLRLRTPGGAALVGRELEFEHAELGETPDAWIQAGLLDPAALPAVSDAKGEIRLDGLPAGTYRWRSQAQGHLQSSGELELSHGATIELVIDE